MYVHLPRNKLVFNIVQWFVYSIHHVESLECFHIVAMSYQPFVSEAPCITVVLVVGPVWMDTPTFTKSRTTVPNEVSILLNEPKIAL